MYNQFAAFFPIITGKMAELNSFLHLPVLPVFIKKASMLQAFNSLYFVDWR